MRAVIVIAVLAALVYDAQAAESIRIGCSVGRQKGDVWYPAGCQRCSCNGKNEVCTSCGTVSIDAPGCEVTFDRTLQYPECCEPILTCA